MKTATSILAVVGSVMLAGQAARPLPNIAAPVMFDTPTSGRNPLRAASVSAGQRLEPGYLVDARPPRLRPHHRLDRCGQGARLQPRHELHHRAAGINRACRCSVTVYPRESDPGPFPIPRERADRELAVDAERRHSAALPKPGQSRSNNCSGKAPATVM